MTRKPMAFDVNPLFTGPTLEARNKLGSPFRYLRISEIDVDPDQPRRVFSSESLQDLSASIKKYGVLCPVLVRVTAGGTYRLVAGERRFRACKMLDMETIPAIIDQDDPEGNDTLSKQLVENIQREDLTPMERALAIGQFRDALSLSVREIAARLGVSKSLVQRSLEILSLPDDLQAALIAGASESKVLVLGQIKDAELRAKLLGEIDQLTREQLERTVALLVQSGSEENRSSHGGTEKGTVKKAGVSAEDQRLIEDIQRAIGTKVSLSRSSNKPEQGRLNIDFYSNADLDEIFRRLIAPSQ